MYHYNFTNDLRISNLDSTLKDAAHAFLTDTVPSSTVDKSKNNNFMTVGFYFNLKAKGICAKLAEFSKFSSRIQIITSRIDAIFAFVLSGNNSPSV